MVYTHTRLLLRNDLGCATAATSFVGRACFIIENMQQIVCLGHRLPPWLLSSWTTPLQRAVKTFKPRYYCNRQPCLFQQRLTPPSPPFPVVGQLAELKFWLFFFHEGFLQFYIYGIRPLAAVAMVPTAAAAAVLGIATQGCISSKGYTIPVKT